MALSLHVCCLQGGKLTRAPSMTLSESQALDSFDFLGAEDAALLHRMSRVSFCEGSEGTRKYWPASPYCVTVFLCGLSMCSCSAVALTTVTIVTTAHLCRSSSVWVQ